MLRTIDISRMADGWGRERLQAVLDASDRSMREVSIAAGLSVGYLHGILKDNKDPTIGRLVAICDQLDVTVSYVLYGVEMSRDAETLLRLYSELSEDQRKHLLLLAESARKLAEK